MAKQQKFKVTIPKGYSPRERQAIAREVIDFVIERSKKGKDKNNKKFPVYSKEYKNSEAFEGFGKKPNKVNLTLTGEMLEELSYLNDKNGELTLGYEKGDKELNGKVEGNVLGTYGKKKADPKKARDFMGIKKTDLDKILKKYPMNNKKAALRAEAIFMAEEEGISLTEAIDKLEDEFLDEI